METSEPNNLDSPSDPTPVLKFREGCVLNRLSAAQQEQLFDWLELHPPKAVLGMVAAPPPEGFGIQTHLKSLRRFHQRARTLFHKELTAAPLELLGEPGSGIADDQLTVALLRQFAVEMATVQQRDPAHFASVSRWALRLQQNAQRERELKILEDRIALQKSKAEVERTKFEFNAARAALSCLRELNEIAANHPGDDEDKIWATRDKIFPPRSALIENPNLQSTDSTK